ncbi:BTAD domain-containing putative transcriptional regulator [Catellatospora sp. NPDC049609]|uniref:BTAD domain-containing putative transcriptional regulator n=1 Tax=Catellatospora sp. NPDC049609 TaxID=3155505 RepID=UPI00341EC5CE
MQDGPSPVGRSLRERRARAGLSQSMLAARAAVSLAALRDLEQGRVARPRPDTVRRLAQALDLSPPETATLLRTARGGEAAGVRIQVLGPLLVTAGAAEVGLGSPKRRELLALLALSPGVPVSRDELVELLWGTPNGARLLHTHVSRLRARLEPYPVRIVAAGGGYRLDVAVAQLDLAVFRHALGHARRLMAGGEREQAVRRYREAAAMWHGQPLADLPALQTHPAVIALGRDRRACAVEYADAGAPPDEVLAVLRPLAAADPLDEAVCLRLMAALAGTGQRAAALAEFGALRRGLREELGVDPAPELERAYRDLLARTAGPAPDPVPPPTRAHGERGAGDVPEQLPAPPPTFSGRAGDLAVLDGLVASWTGETTLLCAVTGMAGVGKSTLAAHWAHAARGSFPDGRLYADLRGFDPARPAMTSGEVVRLFLEALRPGEPVPPTPQAQVARYRSLLAGRRMLILLDNARDAEQVRAILPGTPGCLVLVTSRDRLTGLVAVEGAHPLPLGVFAADEARAYLTRRLGARRTGADAQAVAEIVERCGRLPLALAVVAARAAAHPWFTLAALAAELRSGQGALSALEVNDRACDVRSVFAHSYQDLDEARARLFRLLALHPGPEISVAAAAALAGAGAGSVHRHLRDLARAHLLEEPSPGRFRFHDLLRAYAYELVQATESDDGRAAAAQRMFGHYLDSAARAALLIAPHRDRVIAEPGPAGEPQGGHREAFAWFDVEYPALLAMVDVAPDPYLWRLGWVLAPYQDRAGRWRDWAQVQEKAVAAAERTGDRLGAAHSRRGHGRALTWLRRHDAAHAALRGAIEAFTALGDTAALGHLELDLSDVYEQSGRPESALHHAERAVALYEQAGHRSGLANALNIMCFLLAAVGRHELAVHYGERALRLQCDLDDRRGQAATQDSLGVAYSRLGRHALALAGLDQARRLFAEVGDRPGVADVLLHLGDCHLAAGSRGQAVTAWRAALEIFEELGLGAAEQALSRLGGP